MTYAFFSVWQGWVLCRSLLLADSGVQLPPAPERLEAPHISQALQELQSAVSAALTAAPGHSEHERAAAWLQDAHASAAAACAPFVWEDGPLVKAMREGCVLLIDEVNLAEDAVLERLNSVLEPGRTLLLAEKGGPVPEKIVAAEGFRVVATMNPGGDHGKRELSPALSNRFTQVCCVLLVHAYRWETACRVRLTNLWSPPTRTILNPWHCPRPPLLESPLCRFNGAVVLLVANSNTAS